MELMITKEKLISYGAEKLADILLSLYENHTDIQKQLDITFAGLNEDPKKLISMIKIEITALKRSSRFIDYYESSSFSERLNQLRVHIIHELSQKSPLQALHLLLEFLDLHETILNRVDDSNGTVSGVFMEACEDLGRVALEARYPVEDTVTLVFDRFMYNGYGIYDDIIPHFKDALTDKGLKALQQRLEDASNLQNKTTVKIGLQAIADCHKDVEAYIRACSLTDKPGAHDHLEIAKRLITHWRGEEALQWLEAMDLPATHGWQQERRALKIQALDLCGDSEKAQEECIKGFEKVLSVELYGEILKHAKPDFKEAFRKTAVQKAFRFSDPHVSLSFLIQIQEFEEASKLVRHKIDELEGGRYYTLRPTADVLREVDPLSATLLYRKLIEPILQEAKSKYYTYAAKDLVSCGLLSAKVTGWDSFLSHPAYLAELMEKHKRKVSFWAEYKTRLQKQDAKEAKRKIARSKDNEDENNGQ